MRMLPVVILMGAVLGSPALAVGPVLWTGPGSGAHNPGGGGRDVCWSEPGDLEGVLGSSEVIDQFGLETEIANDFVVSGDLITMATWWGGEYGNSTPCVPEWPTPGFNLLFYEDDNCAPGALVTELSITDFTEEFLVCGHNGFEPYYKYSANISVPVTPGLRYWFVAQFKSHPFPGQGGRLTTVGETGCGSMFKSAYFGYPDWTPIIVVFGAAYDYGQEFECGVTATQSSTWGMIRSLYR